MDDDYGLDAESAETPEQTSDQFDQLQDRDLARKLRNENKSLRDRALEAEEAISRFAEQRYSDYLDIVPEGLSATKRLEFLEKVSQKFGSATNPTGKVETVETPEVSTPEVPTQQEQQLAAVAKGPSSTSASPPSGYTQDELLQIYMDAAITGDTSRVEKLKADGVRLSSLDDDPKYFGPSR